MKFSSLGLFSSYPHQGGREKTRYWFYLEDAARLEEVCRGHLPPALFVVGVRKGESVVENNTLLAFVRGEWTGPSRPISNSTLLEIRDDAKREGETAECLEEHFDFPLLESSHPNGGWREAVCLRHVPEPPKDIGITAQELADACQCRRCRLARALAQLLELGVRFTPNSEKTFIVRRRGSGGRQLVSILAGGISSGWIEFGHWLVDHQGPKIPDCAEKIASEVALGGSAGKIYISRVEAHDGNSRRWRWVVSVLTSYKEGKTAYVHTYGDNSSFKEVFEKILP